MTAESPAAARKTASPLHLVASAIGGPTQIAGKLGRLGRTLRLWLDQRRSEPSPRARRSARSRHRDALALAARLRRLRHAALRDRARRARLLRAAGHLVRLPPAAARARRPGLDDRPDRLPLRARHHHRSRDAGGAPESRLRSAAAPVVSGRARGTRSAGRRDGGGHASAAAARSARSSRIRPTTRACSTTSAATGSIPRRRRSCARSRPCAAIPTFVAAERTFATLPAFSRTATVCRRVSRHS